MIVYDMVMEKDECAECLKDKLLEETKADLFEVIHTLSKENGLSIEQIEEKRISKKQERGGFENRIYIDY
ncbi:hypothetical protein [Wolbachia endosymbiont (group B) of Gerris lacustris]|uniref:hypothetical protein n=1 Tax=Wolbachia endosymbiont (group B) of Gerris lacustris TaxID=3066159 RepID=UPI00333EDC0D